MIYVVLSLNDNLRLISLNAVQCSIKRLNRFHRRLDIWRITSLPRLPFSKRELAVRSANALGGFEIARSLSAWQGLLVLNYHRIGSADGQPWDPGLWSATAEDFEWQMRYLKSHYDVIGQSDLANVIDARKGRHVLVTFDDGYRDNFELAYPILKSCSVPALFFLATGFLDKPKIPWWDEIAWMAANSSVDSVADAQWFTAEIKLKDENRVSGLRQLLRVYKNLPADQTAAYLEFLGKATQSGRCPESLSENVWMTWDMVREMYAGGMSFGGHTVHHPVLSNLSKADQQREISECYERIAQELGIQPIAFSYPVGGPSAFNADTETCVRNQGYLWAFSYHGGFSRAGEPYGRFALPRVPVESETSRPAFKALAALPQWFG